MSEAQFMKPGQKYPAPSPGAGDRVFYETLYQEKKDCQMALTWCIEHGVLNGEELTQALARANKLGKSVVAVAAGASVSVSKSVTASKSSSKASKVINVAVDAGMSVGGGQGIGSMDI